MWSIPFDLVTYWAGADKDDIPAGWKEMVDLCVGKIDPNQWPKLTYIPYRVLGRSSRFGFCWIYVIVQYNTSDFRWAKQAYGKCHFSYSMEMWSQGWMGANCHRRRRGRRSLLLRTAMRIRSMPLAHAWYPAPMYRPTPNALRPARRRRLQPWAIL